MISAVRADDLIPVGVAAFETAIRDADRLTAQDRLAAVAGPTGERGCRDGLELNAQPRVTAITRGRCGDGGRTSISHDVIRVANTAHSTHRQESLPGRYRGLEQRRRLSPDGSTQAVRGHVPPSRRTPGRRTRRCPARLERAASLASKEARPERIQAGLFPAPLGGGRSYRSVIKLTPTLTVTRSATLTVSRSAARLAREHPGSGSRRNVSVPGSAIPGMAVGLNGAVALPQNK